MDRCSSPGPLPGDSAAVIAWRNALKVYRKSLSEKDLKRISVPAKPEDVLDAVEKWERKQARSKYSRVSSAVRDGLARLQRFSGAIDMLAQGSPAPGCLLWGSIKFVLVIVQDAAEEYQKLGSALTRIIECLPEVERYAETFLESQRIKDCIETFYVSILRFWTRACKFYRRHRFFNLGRVIWNDFDAEFGELEVEMDRNRNRVESAALVEHIGESKYSRTQQRLVNQDLLEAQATARQKEITAWLAPSAYDVNYYEADLLNAKNLQHPNTCRWILDKEVYVNFTKTNPKEPLLWVYAQPGAGKTVLSSFLIEHYSRTLNLANAAAGDVLYFFCKNADADKNTPTAVIRSLLYQTYSAARTRGKHHRLSKAIGEALDRSGQQRAVTFATMWQLFSTHIDKTISTIIIIDALDECQDPEPLIDSLKLLATNCPTQAIITSRREAHLDRRLSNTLACEITSEDTDADIAAFVDARVSASSLLSNALVRDLVITRLTQYHDGMFLWVHLMLEELKFCFAPIHVQEALERLPGGLSGTYESIVHRLRKTLKRPAFDLCCKVLMWVVSAIRPLKLDEIRHALELQYKLDGYLLLTDDGSFPYSVRDLELICGSLITVRNGTLQVIHMTAKEYLRSSHGAKRSLDSELLIEHTSSSLQLTMVCLSCIQVHCSRPIADLDKDISRIDMKVDGDAVAERQSQAPFLEYALLSWVPHLMDCEDAQVPGVMTAFGKTFNSQSTFIWVETCMIFQPHSLTRLIVGLVEILDWIPHHHDENELKDSDGHRFFVHWCLCLQRIFQQYGSVLAKLPWEAYFLDLRACFEELADFYEINSKTAFRERSVQLEVCRSGSIPYTKPSPLNQLQPSIDRLDTLLLLMHDECRGVYFSSEERPMTSNLQLYAQNVSTGQRLPPAESLTDHYAACLQSSAMSPNGRHICIVYTYHWAHEKGEGQDFTVIWQIDETISFTRSMLSKPWAKIIFADLCNLTLGDSPRSIVFLNNEYCFTPSGRIHLPSRHRDPLHSCVQNLLTYPTVGYYQGSGDKLVLSQQDRKTGEWYAESFDPLKGTPGVSYSWIDKSWRMADLSPSGRFLVLRGHEDTGEQLHVYDVKTSTTISLPFLRSLSVTHRNFFFPMDNQSVVAFLVSKIYGVEAVSVFVWDIVKDQSNLRCYGDLRVGRRTIPRSFQVHVNKDEISALMASTTGSIQRIEFCKVVVFPNAPHLNDDLPYSRCFIANDGAHFACLKFGKDSGYLEMYQLRLTEKAYRKVYLRWSSWNDPDTVCIAMSPNLKLLSFNNDVFDLSNDANSSQLTPFTLAEVQDLLEVYESNRGVRLECNISPCESYIMFSIRNLSLMAEKQCQHRLLVFHIDVKSRSSTMLDLNLPPDLSTISAAFHPFLPILIVGHARNAALGANFEEDAKEQPAITVATFHLPVFQREPIALPRNARVMSYMRRDWDQDGRLPVVGFSKCGTFAFMESSWYPWWSQIIQSLEVNPEPARYLQAAFPKGLSNQTASGGQSFFEFGHLPDNSVFLRMKNLSKQEGIYHDEDGVEAHIWYLTASPFGSADAEHFLLFGADDDETMRMLVVPPDGRPPEIKWLSTTFNEAKAKLEMDWKRRLSWREEKEDSVEDSQNEDDGNEDSENSQNDECEDDKDEDIEDRQSEDNENDYDGNP